MKNDRKIVRYYIIGISLIFFLVISCNSKAKEERVSYAKMYTVMELDSIVKSEMKVIRLLKLDSQNRRDALDSLIDKHPTIGYFYQQRAMPLYKQDKDELGLPFLEKAAELSPEKYLDYMGFMKCIFSKEYKSAIVDFEKVLALNGASYVMDHTYYFYIGLSYLQLNQFEKAKSYLERSIAQTVVDKNGDRDWVHFLDLMYLGIANLELQDCENANRAFDEALSKYPSFGDVKYYKARCLMYLGEEELSQQLFKEAREDLLKGNTINEDNVYYERYPYQLRVSWFR